MRLHLTAARGLRSAVLGNWNIVFALQLPPRRRQVRRDVQRNPMRIPILMAAFVSTLGRLFGGDSSKPQYKTADVYDGLRNQILGLKAEQLGASTVQPVLAVAMETGYPEAIATLVAVMDGSASLYFSNGGGIIGAGGNPEPNAAARKLVAKASEFKSVCAATTVFPLPQKAHTRFYIITPNGVLTSEAKEVDLGN